MRPGAGLVAALVACAAFGAAVVAGLVPTLAFWLLAAVLCVVAASDFARLRATATPTVSRDLPAVVPVGIERTVTLRVQHGNARAVTVDVHDLHPAEWPHADLPRRVQLAPASETSIPYSLTPVERGLFRFEGTDLVVHSPWRFWRSRRRAVNTQVLRVFPNFAPIARLALVGAEQASRVVGAHMRRQRGEGTEFQQLREYRTGDSMRQIDWKASRRAQKMISREYQVERNQQVMLVLDTGRRMLARDGTLAHFDHVLNAALMVAYIALKRGDAVGLLATGGMTRFMRPRRGLGAVNELLDATFDLQPTPIATDYIEAATRLTTHQPRRSLVLIVTNARDEDVEELLIAVRQLQRRHLVCVASLREQALDDALAAPVRRFDDAIRAASVARYLEDRNRAHEALRAEHVPVLDVTSAALPAALVEHYLAVKRAASL